MSSKTATAKLALATAAVAALPLLTAAGTAHARLPFVGPPAASTLSEASAETLLKWADADRSRGECSLAIGLYGQVLDVQPSSAAALIGRGKAYLARREFDRALQDYDKAVVAAPQSAEAFYGRATVRLMMQEQEEQAAAIATSGEGTASNATQSSAATTSTSVLDGSQFDAEGTARSCELPAINVMKQKERTNQILADLDKAANLNPKLASIWYRKATVCENAGRMEEAKAAYSEYLTRSTNKSSLAWAHSQARLAVLNTLR